MISKHAALFLLLAAAASAQEPEIKAVDRKPAGGKKGYRMLVPPNLKEGETRAVVLWLHPSGGYMNEPIIKDFGAALAKRRVFLMLPESASPAGWSADDLPLLQDFLRDAKANFAVDTRRVILMGYSAGGQLAFALWNKPDFGLDDAGAVVGIVTYAAYPIRNPRDPKVGLPPLDVKLPAVLMVCGSRDGGLRVCRAAQEALLAREGSARLITVPGLGHAYSSSHAETVADWIADVADGKVPAADRLYLDEGPRKTAEALLARTAEALAKPPGELELKWTAWADAVRGVSIQVPPEWLLVDDRSGALAVYRAPDAATHRRLTVRETASDKGWDGLFEQRRAEFAAAGVRWEQVGVRSLKLFGHEARVVQEHVRPLTVSAGARPEFTEESLHVISVHVALDGGKFVRFSFQHPSTGTAEEASVAVDQAIRIFRTIRAKAL